jgi:uncharacterized protein YdeI (BOF family)
MTLISMEELMASVGPAREFMLSLDSGSRRRFEMGNGLGFLAAVAAICRIKAEQEHNTTFDHWVELERHLIENIDDDWYWFPETKDGAKAIKKVRKMQMKTKRFNKGKA